MKNELWRKFILNFCWRKGLHQGSRHELSASVDRVRCVLHIVDKRAQQVLRFAAGGADEDGVAAAYASEQIFFGDEILRIAFFEFFEMIFTRPSAMTVPPSYSRQSPATEDLSLALERTRCHFDGTGKDCDR